MNKKETMIFCKFLPFKIPVFFWALEWNYPRALTHRYLAHISGSSRWYCINCLLLFFSLSCILMLIKIVKQNTCSQHCVKPEAYPKLPNSSTYKGSNMKWHWFQETPILSTAYFHSVLCSSCFISCYLLKR